MPNGFDFTVILRTPWRGPWRIFSNPINRVTAYRPADVRDAIIQVDHHVASGLYAAGFVAYEAAAAFGLPLHGPPRGLPLVDFAFFEPDQVETLARLPAGDAMRLGSWKPSISRAEYEGAIAAIKRRIERGDTYQINFTFRLQAEFLGDPRTLMRDLYAAQAGEWSVYLETPELAVCSASPELFFALADGRMWCRPMKGTAARGFWPEQDTAYAEALRTSEKNRAENVMIVDMVRNDLGRLAQTGSVRAEPMFEVEHYPLQWQMTSTVAADVETRSMLRIFEAMFPTGSITGAPKHSSMGIIRELETTPRGIYTGAMGYISPNRRAHFNVAIRTVVIERARGTAQFGVGSGIVWDSTDRDEYEECLVKAQMLNPSSARRRHVPSYVLDDPPAFRLLETLLWTPERGFVLLERHMARLQASAACFGFVIDPAEIRSLLEHAVADLRGPAKVRLQLEADGDIVLDAVDLVPLPTPLRVALAGEPVDRSSVFLYHKTTNREVYDRARAQHPDADAVLLWNDVGEITEATESNVVVEIGGRKLTPPVECGLLPGTMRAELLAAGKIVEERVTKDDLRRASAVWLVNSVRGWLQAEVV